MESNLLKQRLKKLEIPDDYWGISPESLYIYLADIAIKKDFLSNFIKIVTFEKKIKKDEKEYRLAIASFAEYLGLSRNSDIQPLGKIALLSSEPLFFLQTLLVSKDHFFRNFVVTVKDQQIEVVDKSEFESFFPNDTEHYQRLLQSFHFLTIKKNKGVLEQTIIQRIAAITPFSAKTGNWLSGRSFFETLFPGDHELDEKLTVSLLGLLEIQFEKDNKELNLVEALKHIGNTVEQTLQAIISRPDAVLTSLDFVKRNLENEDIKLLDSLKFSNPKKPFMRVKLEELGTISSKFNLVKNRLERVIDQIVFLQGVYSQLYLSYILSVSQVPLEQLTILLKQLFGNEVKVDNYFVTFKSTFSVPEENGGNLNEYLTFVMHSFVKNEERIKKIKEMKHFLYGNNDLVFAYSIESAVKGILYNLIDELSVNKFLPFYFVYTLPLPQNLGKELIDDFKGESPELQREVYKLECKWPSLMTTSSSTYVDMTNKLFSKGISNELVTKEICIMTPYTDYEIEKYVSMIRTLITNGYTVRIICRLHKNRKRWKIFRDGLLKGLGDKNSAVKVHTYTRFKKFTKVSQSKQVVNDLRNEFGVHAKLFIIGDPSNGAVLLGSANLLENSFNWNPECGVYTEEPDFIKSAKAFFDFVWDLSEKDNLDFSKLDRIPKGPFFPHMYQK